MGAPVNSNTILDRRQWNKCRSVCLIRKKIRLMDSQRSLGFIYTLRSFCRQIIRSKCQHNYNWHVNIMILLIHFWRMLRYFLYHFAQKFYSAFKSNAHSIANWQVKRENWPSTCSYLKCLSESDLRLTR